MDEHVKGVQRLMERGVMRRLRHNERGSVLVLVALWLPVAVLMATLVIDIGHWFEHKRHLQLQADAAALAGGDSFGACFNSGGGSTLVLNEATKYAGSVGRWNGVAYGTPLYNPQIGGSQKGPVSIRYQSPTYENGLNPADGTETNGPCETPSLMFDVKATESNLPWFFGAGKFVSAINAHARVQLRPLHDTNPSLPLAVPDTNPKEVGVTFVNETGGAELTGCTGPNILSGTTCTFLLTKGAPAGGLNMWSGPSTVTLPAAPARIGVRVGLGGQVRSCAGTNGSNAFSCYDGSSTTAGLPMIRDYGLGSPAPPTPPSTLTAPVLEGVWPTSCSGNGAFFFIMAGAGTCTSGVTAEVNYGTGATQPPNNYFITATVGGTTKNLLPVAYDNTRGAWIWATSSATPFALAAQGGAQGISMAWEVQDTTKIFGGKPCTDKKTNPCQGSFASSPQQRFYSGIDDQAGSGPIRSMQIAGGSDPNGPASLVPGTYPLTVTIGVAGNYQVHTPCPPPPSGKAYNCPADPSVLLRLKNSSGSTTFTIDCGTTGGGGGDLYLQITNGCANRFSINSTGVCPDVGTPPSPPDCAPVNNVGSGLKRGQVVKAMNDRFAPAPGGCLTNNYPTVSPDDKRVVILMITDFSAFNGSGAGVSVPVITYGAFYITGWDSADASCDTQNEPFPFPGSSDTGMIWGHFITYVNVGGTGGSGVCDPSGLLPCVPVLTQ